MLPFKKRERFLVARFDVDDNTATTSTSTSSSTPPPPSPSSSSSGRRAVALPSLECEESFLESRDNSAPPPSSSNDRRDNARRRRRHENVNPFSNVLPCHQHLQHVAAEMGMPPLAPYLTKGITETDADRNAHRYQLTRTDVGRVEALRELKRRAKGGGGGRREPSDPPPPPVPVKVLDRHGNKYEMSFSHNASTGYCRIIGRDWSRFLRNTAMRRGETMVVYGSHNGRGEHLLALCNM